MRRQLLILPVLMAASNVQAVPLLWRGEVQVTAVVETPTGACHGGWFPGLFFTAIYQPRGLTGNGTSDQFSFFRENSAWEFMVVGGAYPNPTVNLNYVLKSGGFVAKNGQQLTGVAVMPAVITTTTPYVVFQMTVPDVFGNIGCKANFLGVLQKGL